MSVPRHRIVLLAVAGAVCGHTIAYSVSFPERAMRQSVLQLTGHAYWHAAIAAAVIAAAWFAVSHIVFHARTRTRPQSLWPALPALQLAVFFGMEISERVAAGASLSTLLHNAPVAIACQLLVAALLALGAYLLGRGAAAVAELLWSVPVRRAVAAFAAVPLDAPTLRLAVVPCGSRGPPLP